MQWNLDKLVEVVGRHVARDSRAVEMHANRTTDELVVRGDNKCTAFEKQQKPDRFQRRDSRFRQTTIKIVYENNQRNLQLIQKLFESITERLNFVGQRNGFGRP
jgi:hypothetical protein